MHLSGDWLINGVVSLRAAFRLDLTIEEFLGKTSPSRLGLILCMLKIYFDQTTASKKCIE